MESWHDLFKLAVSDAKFLATEGRYRAATNRAYYSIYYCVTAKSGRKAPFNTQGWLNPQHDQIPGMVAQIPGITADEKVQIKKYIADLFRRRIDADYHQNPGVTEEDFRKTLEILENTVTLLKESS
jgi:uncharacterized protein (UPF0332 family)